MPARVIANGRADHSCWQAPLTQQAGNDGSIIKHKLTEFSHQRAGIVLWKFIEHHNGDGRQHTKAYISRRNFFCISHNIYSPSSPTLLPPGEGSLLSLWERARVRARSEEHTSELQSRRDLV